MRRSNRQQKNWRAISLIAAVTSLLPLLAFSQVMESSSYKIQFDSVNVGGVRSVSSSYIIEDTVGEIATGESASASYKIKAGYQQMNEVYLAITPASDVTMSPELGGLTGGIANGSTAVTATTDNRAGYELSIKASSSPALVFGSESIADYTPGGANPDFDFIVAATDSEFGYSPEGTDIAQRFQDNGSACNAGSSDASDKCWDGLSTSDVNVASRTSSNHPSGTATTVKFRTEIGTSAFQLAGTYTATTTLTLIAL